MLGHADLASCCWSGSGLAVLLPVIPFSLELLALRRLTTAAFGTLMSLEPAIALVIGLVVLHQVPGWAAVVGIAFVVAAGIGAERTGGREPTATPGRLRPCPVMTAARSAWTTARAAASGTTCAARWHHTRARSPPPRGPVAWAGAAPPAHGLPRPRRAPGRPFVLTDFTVPPFDAGSVAAVAGALAGSCDAVLVGEHQDRPDFPPDADGRADPRGRRAAVDHADLPGPQPHRAGAGAGRAGARRGGGRALRDR